MAAMQAKRGRRRRSLASHLDEVELEERELVVRLWRRLAHGPQVVRVRGHDVAVRQRDRDCGLAGDERGARVGRVRLDQDRLDRHLQAAPLACVRAAA